MSINNIISKFLMNKTDQHELAQLQEWQSEARENIEALKDMQKIFALDMSDYQSFDKGSAWDNIETKINAESGNEYGKVVRLKKWIMGSVAILALIASTTFAWKNYAKESYPAQYATTNTIKVNQLPDATVVHLDRLSTLNIEAEDFNTNRKVKLDGRAYFDVTSDSAHPFNIEMNQGHVTVIGTEFSLSTLKGQDEIYVTEGKVRYTIGDRSFDLTVGDYIKVINGDVVKLEMKHDQYLSWKSGKLVLSDENIHDALKLLSNHFQTKISIDSNLSTANCRISTTIEHQTLDETLEELSILFSIKYSKNSNGITISNLEC